MIRKRIFILVAVIGIAIFFAACHPHRWHRGCEISSPIGADAVSGTQATWEIQTVERF